MTNPAPFERPREPVPQPPSDPDKPTMHWPGVYEAIVAMSDKEVWDTMSETAPPVAGA
jgi:hypothetical protein